MLAFDPQRVMAIGGGRCTAALAAGAVAAAVVGCGSDPDSTPSPATGQAMATVSPVAAAMSTPLPPGRGVVQARLVDATTGLPVARVEARLTGRGRQTVSQADGRVRFDSVAPGIVGLVLRPGDDHLPRTFTATLGASGLDLGLVLMTATGPPTLVVPEYGGVVGGCGEGATQIAFASDSLAAAAPVRVTCISDPTLLPAPPPVGRLPLGHVDLKPWDALLDRPAVLTVALPAQPRYGPGVGLDLYRLDEAAMAWSAAGSLVVDTGSRTATGEVTALGSFLVASPPLGALGETPGPAPILGGYRTAPRPGGPPRSLFEPGTAVVYFHFEYRAMDNTAVAVRTTDADGTIMFAGARPYSGDGADDVPMAVPRGWPPGQYTTAVRIDGNGPVGKVEWSVARGPPPTPVVSRPGHQAVAPRGPGCRPPGGWFPYRVVAGDTLYALALRFGLVIAVLKDANCLTGDTIYTGQTLYLPRPVPPPPSRWPPLVPPSPPPGAPGPPGGPAPMPTTWYTPPAATSAPPSPSATAPGPAASATPPGPSSPTAPAISAPTEEPTLAPRPTAPPMP